MKAPSLSLAAALALPIVFTAHASAAITSLSAHWSFDEGVAGTNYAGSSYADSSGNGNTLSVGGAAPLVANTNGAQAAIGNATEIRRIEGVGNVTTLSATASPSLSTSSFTISMIFDEVASDYKGTNFMRSGDAGLGWGIETLNDSGQGQLNFYVFAANGQVVDVQSAHGSLPFEPYEASASGQPADNVNDIEQWHQAVVSYDATTGTVTMYLDGVANMTVNTNAAMAGVGPRYGTPGSGDFHAGDYLSYYDDLQVYDGAATPSQVAYLFANPGATIPEAGSCVLAAMAAGGMLMRRRR